MQEFSESATPGKYIADLFPPLAQLPIFMQWWRKSANQYMQRQANIWMKYWSRLKAQMAENKAPDCFVKQFMETDYKKQDISDIQAAFVAGSKLSS